MFGVNKYISYFGKTGTGFMLQPRGQLSRVMVSKACIIFGVSFFFFCHLNWNGVFSFCTLHKIVYMFHWFNFLRPQIILWFYDFLSGWDCSWIDTISLFCFSITRFDTFLSLNWLDWLKFCFGPSALIFPEKTPAIFLSSVIVQLVGLNGSSCAHCFVF